jgi:hypothetical protein
LAQGLKMSALCWAANQPFGAMQKRMTHVFGESLCITMEKEPLIVIKITQPGTKHQYDFSFLSSFYTLFLKD